MASNAKSTRDLVRAAACEVFYEFGYHGASVREIASRRGVTVAALYHHYPSKADLLAEVVVRFMEGVVEHVGEAVAGAEGTAVERLAAAVRANVLFLTGRQTEGFVANAEIRYLTDENHERAIEAQRALQHCYEKILQEGTESGEFEVPNIRITARVIMSMCTAILSWYKKGDAASDIGDMYAHLALRLANKYPHEANSPLTTAARTS